PSSAIAVSCRSRASISARRRDNSDSRSALAPPENTENGWLSPFTAVPGSLSGTLGGLYDSAKRCYCFGPSESSNRKRGAYRTPPFFYFRGVSPLFLFWRTDANSEVHRCNGSRFRGVQCVCEQWPAARSGLGSRGACQGSDHGGVGDFDHGRRYDVPHQRVDEGSERRAGRLEGRRPGREPRR